MAAQAKIEIQVVPDLDIRKPPRLEMRHSGFASSVHVLGVLIDVLNLAYRQAVQEGQQHAPVIIPVGKQ